MPTKHQKELKHERRSSQRIKDRQSWEAEMAARPLTVEMFSDLRQYIQERSAAESTGVFDACHEHEHRLRLVLEFLHQRGVELSKAIDWFQKYEATCDHLVVQLGDEWGPYGCGFERRYA